MSIFLCCGVRRPCRPSRIGPDLPSNKDQTPPKLTEAYPPVAQYKKSLKPQAQSRDILMMPSAILCQDPTELAQLVVDDSEGEGKRDDTLTNSNSALNAVRSKLIRHISQESEPSHQARPAAGYSQEEIARRAELRRFRHQRIQEELKSEESNDESSSTSHRSTRYLSPLIDVGQPGNGPRDTIEFAVDDGLSDISPSKLPIVSAENESLGDIYDVKERSTTNNAAAKVTSKADGENHNHSSEMLPTSDLLPESPQGINDSTCHRPDRSSHDFLRHANAMGVDNEFDIRHEAHTTEEQSALGIWLIAQGLRSRTNSIRTGDKELTEKITPNQTPLSIVEPGGIDRIADLPLQADSQSLVIPRILPERLAAVVQSQHQADQDSFESASFSSATDEFAKKSGDGPSGPISESIMAESDEPSSSVFTITRPVDNSSSNYPSVLPSFQPSPNRSQSNFHYLSVEDLESLQLSPFSWQGNFSVVRGARASEGKSSYATAEDDISYSDINGSSVQIIRPSDQAAGNSMSPAYSETASFHQREAELQTIEKRFGQSFTRKKPLSNVGSRFKEEFHLGPSGIGRPSLMAKINLSVSRRSKHGPSNLHETQPRSCSAGAFLLDPRPEKSPEKLSKQAYHGPLSLHSRRHGSILSEATASHRALNKKGVYRLSLISVQDAASETSRLTPQSDELLPDEPSKHSRGILQQWSANLHSVLSGDAKPAQSGQFTFPRRLSKPTQSWSRHSSQSQGERMKILSFKQTTLPIERDASKYSSGDLPSSEVKKPLDAASSHTEYDSASLPTKLGKVVRSGLKKLISTPQAHHVNSRDLDGPSQDISPTIDNAEVHERQLMLRNAEPQTTTNTRSLPWDTAKDQASSLESESPTVTVRYRKFVPCTKSSSAGKLNVESWTHEVSPGFAEPIDQEHSDLHQIDSELAGDVFSTPLSKFMTEGEGDGQTETVLSPANIRSQEILRRWRSSLDIPESKKGLLSYPARPLGQSLSMGNLKD